MSPSSTPSASSLLRPSSWPSVKRAVVPRSSCSSQRQAYDEPGVVLRVGITGFRQSLQLLKHFLRTGPLWFSHDAVAVDPGPTAGWQAIQSSGST